LFLLLDPSAPFSEKNHALAITVHFLEGSLGVGNAGKANESVGLNLVKGTLPFVDGDAAVIFGVGVATSGSSATLLAINQGEGVEHQGVDAKVRVQEAELALVDVVVFGGLDAADGLVLADVLGVVERTDIRRTVRLPDVFGLALGFLEGGVTSRGAFGQAGFACNRLGSFGSSHRFPRGSTVRCR